MAKIILHTEQNLEAIKERRLRENFSLSHHERMKRAFDLMRLSLLFKKGSIKAPQGKGVLLKM